MHQLLFRYVFHPLTRENQSRGLAASQGNTRMSIWWVCGLELTAPVNDADWCRKVWLWGSQECSCCSPCNCNCSPRLGASRARRAWEGEKCKGRLWKLFCATAWVGGVAILLAKNIFTDSKTECSSICKIASYLFPVLSWKLIKIKMKKTKSLEV